MSDDKDKDEDKNNNKNDIEDKIEVGYKELRDYKFDDKTNENEMADRKTNVDSTDDNTITGNSRSEELDNSEDESKGRKTQAQKELNSMKRLQQISTYNSLISKEERARRYKSRVKQEDGSIRDTNSEPHHGSSHNDEVHDVHEVLSNPSSPIPEELQSPKKKKRVSFHLQN